MMMIKRRKFLWYISALVVIAASYAFTIFFPPASGNSGMQESFVTKVIDGDTVVVEGGERIRLLNIDSRERGENCYAEAKQRMEDLVLMKNVTLERDIEDKDQYDRLLKYIYVNGSSANLQMVKDGLAIVYIIEPNTKHANDFKAAEAEAKTQGGCIWTKMP